MPRTSHCAKFPALNFPGFHLDSRCTPQMFIWIPVVRHKFSCRADGPGMSFSFGFQLHATNFHPARVGPGCHFHLDFNCTLQISIPRGWAWDVFFIWIPIVRHNFSFGFQLYATNFHAARVGFRCHCPRRGPLDSLSAQQQPTTNQQANA